jgi:Spy/CpxP family protein refolding chaperone
MASRQASGWPVRAFCFSFPVLATLAAIIPVLIPLLFPAACSAGDIPPGRWWHIPYFADQLSISDRQKEDLDRLFDYNRNKLAELKKQMEDERSELLRAINQEHLNESSTLAAMRKLENTRTLMAATRFSYSLEVRKLLGYERFQRLRALRRNWRALPVMPALPALPPVGR